MKKLPVQRLERSSVAAFLAMAPPTYARGGTWAAVMGNAVGMVGTAVTHAAVGHVKGGHGAFSARGGRGRQFVGAARGRRALCRARILSNSRRSYRWLGRLLRISTAMDIPAIVTGYYGLGYGYPYYGYYGYRSGSGTMIHITDTTLGDIILTATDTGRP